MAHIKQTIIDIEVRKMKVGIIGGSGLYKIEELENAQDLDVETKYDVDFKKINEMEQ